MTDLIKKALNLNVWVAAGLVGLIASVAACDFKRIGAAERRGKAAVVATVNEQAKEKTDAARKARAPAAQPGAAQRLRQGEHCRDC